MSINWMLRLKNKATLSAIIAAVVLFVFNISNALGIAMPIDSDSVMQTVESVLTVLVMLGIVVDPTTHGVGDSENALLYEEPATTRVSDVRCDEEVCG